MEGKSVKEKLSLKALKAIEGGTYEQWQERIKDYPKSKVAHVNYCKARSYIEEDGFFYFCYDILGYREMTRQFHGPICDHIQAGRRYKILQACRGSFKSVIATIGYTVWLIAR